MKKALPIILAACLSSCAIFPTTRTYFKPDPLIGELGQSQSCGYHRAAKDSYVVATNESTISIFPYSLNEQVLSVNLFATHDSSKLELNPNEILVSVSNKNIAPKSFDLTFREKDASHKNTTIYNLHYPIDYSTLDSFTLIFNKKNYTFSKVKKFDIYYASINC